MYLFLCRFPRLQPSSTLTENPGLGNSHSRSPLRAFTGNNRFSKDPGKSPSVALSFSLKILPEVWTLRYFKETNIALAARTG